MTRGSFMPKLLIWMMLLVIVPIKATAQWTFEPEFGIRIES